MKKFTIAAVAAACLIAGWNTTTSTAQAAEIDTFVNGSAPQVEQLSAWSRIRDKILDREDKHKANNKHKNPPPPPRHDYRPAPPPRHDYRPAPPPRQDVRRQAPPPRHDYRQAPPPQRRDDRRQAPPPQRRNDNDRYERDHKSHGGHGPVWGGPHH